MELIKKDDRWDLYNEDGHKIASTLDGCVNKLSLKNCQAIENGYDLDELARSACPDVISSAHSAYKAGFQKALELLGDKKFSEEDMLRAYKQGGNDGALFESIMDYDSEDNDESWEFSEKAEKEFIQSLQQTEWDVEICCHIDDHGTGDGSGDSFSHPMFTNTGIPKFDADGCLILKRK